MSVTTNSSSGNTVSRAALPPPIRISEAAANRIKILVAKAQKPVLGLRVGIKTTGCSGMSYLVEYAEDVRKFEDIVEHQGAKVFIDPKAVMFLLGSELDYRESTLESGFVFNNPNEKSRCGCGESFSV